ncbi:MAG: twin-arginine translocation signal domain-containing protein [Solirubrobacterales bacterium]
MRGGLTRRDLLAAGAAAGAAVALGPRALAAPLRARTIARLDFSQYKDGRGWPGWRTVDVSTATR